MLFDPRFATGPNATALSLPTDEKPISTRKDRKGAQDIPGVNKVPPGQGKEWERKQRAREYRVAARREKRNRKADEKKQRKLNATILRRMTRNPDKYNKNAERNRLRAIQQERQSIWTEAVRQAERLAAEHDPTGATFNVGAVVKQEDGTVISVDTLKRREEGKARRAAELAAKEEAAANGTELKSENSIPNGNLQEGVNYVQMELDKTKRPQGMSKSQQKKLEALKPRPPPPKPVIPEGYSIPEGEENFLSLWDLSDTKIERRVLREKRRKAATRKALRQKQQSGKAERRMARDEKRRVYRDIKLSWKTIKEEEVRERTRLKAQEDEESKRIAVEIADFERKAAMEHCVSLGFTLSNTDGVNDVQPRALGMKGVEIDWNAIEPDDRPGTIRLKNPSTASKPKNPRRVDLGVIPGNAQSFLPPHRQKTLPNTQGDENAHVDAEEFIKLDVGSEHQFQELSYNHKLRRKLRRSLDNAQIAKELLVRERAIAHYTSQELPVPAVLTTPTKPINVRGSRILENGTLETAKQERVRSRLELAEFNRVMKVLRRQAKQTAIEAGLRKHAEVTGRIEVVRTEEEREAERKREAVAAIKAREVVFNNGPSRIVDDDYGLGLGVDSEGDVDMGEAGSVVGGSDSDDSSD
ncbi:hypothetical protein G7Y79_00011g030190 [Physcia stellaris]|nr:hypothetical protein G7Y79_00011g030190 [Physcia stellaris]